MPKVEARFQRLLQFREPAHNAKLWISGFRLWTLHLLLYTGLASLKSLMNNIVNLGNLIDAHESVHLG